MPRPTATLPGRSRTIVVEPIAVPAERPAPEPPDPEPARRREPPPKREPVKPGR
jgi:hypothetical protein